jgi:hypothetical protein
MKIGVSFLFRLSLQMGFAKIFPSADHEAGIGMNFCQKKAVASTQIRSAEYPNKGLPTRFF